MLILASISAVSEPLKVGRSASDPANGLVNLQKLSEQVIEELKGKHYDSYKIYNAENADVPELISIIKDKKIDIMVESLYFASIIADNTNMEPVLLVSRNGSVYIKGFIVTRKDSVIHSVNDLNGKIVTVINTESVPAFLLPKKMIESTGLKFRMVQSADSPVTENSVGYYVTNDKAQAVNNVYLKKTDAAIICSGVWENVKFMPDFIKDNLKIIGTTESVPGIYLLIRRDMEKAKKEKLINIFLTMYRTSRAKNVCDLDGFHKIDFDWKTLFQNLK
jgi:phosphonate transport system substrate-binding protein